MPKIDAESATIEKNSPSVSENGVDTNVEGIFAVDFGGDSTLPTPPTLTSEQEQALYRKIDLRLMPILSLMYLCSFLDRGTCAIVFTQLATNIYFKAILVSSQCIDKLAA